MKLGVVGLPNVGKSTLFNAITKAGAEAANYPFCTIEPNTGVVAVPEDPQEQVVRAYAVTAGPHGFISGVADYVVEFVGYSYFHKCFSKYNLQY